MDILSHFGVLDELIQVIYQGFDRFVVLSTVTESSWIVYVGLKGPEGRWWRGSWSTRDITQLIGPKPSSKTPDIFAHNLCEAFLNGELSVGDWPPDQGAEINLTFGPASKKPVHIPLVELSAKEAASHATTVFCGIALQAQSRKCRLNLPTFSAQSVATFRTASDTPRKKTRVAEPVAQPQAEDEPKAAQRKIKALEAELEHVKAAKKAKSKSPSSELEPKPSVSTRRPKGASLANPHKKARKYEAVEFESDDG